MIFLSSIVCFEWNLGDSGFKFDFKTGKVLSRKKGNVTYKVGKKNCAKLKSICNDLRYIRGCEYIEWQHKTLFTKKDKKLECACKGVKLLILP